MESTIKEIEEMLEKMKSAGEITSYNEIEITQVRGYVGEESSWRKKGDQFDIQVQLYMTEDKFCIISSGLQDTIYLAYAALSLKLKSEVFLMASLERLKGNAPALQLNTKTEKETSVEDKQEELEQALLDEDYEKAALIREELKRKGK